MRLKHWRPTQRNFFIVLLVVVLWQHSETIDSKRWANIYVVSTEKHKKKIRRQRNARIAISLSEWMACRSTVFSTRNLIVFFPSSVAIDSDGDDHFSCQPLFNETSSIYCIANRLLIKFCCKLTIERNKREHQVISKNSALFVKIFFIVLKIKKNTDRKITSATLNCT